MAESKQSVVIGVFDDRQAVIKAIDAFVKAGFHETQLGFAARSSEQHVNEAQKHIKHGPKAITRGIVGGLLGVADMLLVPITGPTDAANILATALPVTEEAIDRLPYPGSHEDEHAHTRPDAAMTKPAQAKPSETPTAGTDTQSTTQPAHPERTGMVAGSVVGGALGAAAGALLIPGVGPVVAGGIIAAALGGGALGSVAGNFLGTFAEIGVPKEEARRYEQEIKAGRTIVTVQANGREQEAANILIRHGAHDVQSH